MSDNRVAKCSGSIALYLASDPAAPQKAEEHWAKAESKGPLASCAFIDQLGLGESEPRFQHNLSTAREQTRLSSYTPKEPLPRCGSNGAEGWKPVTSGPGDPKSETEVAFLSRRTRTTVPFRISRQSQPDCQATLNPRTPNRSAPYARSGWPNPCRRRGRPATPAAARF
jgi:hypothetical protein